MKPDLLISQEIAAVLAASYTLGIGNIHAAQAAADLARPSLAVSGEWQQYGESFRKGILTLEFHSRAGSETSSHEHQTMFGALLKALLGGDTITQASAKSTFKAALATRLAVNVLDYGPKEITSDVDGDDLRTQLSLNMVWRVV